MVRFHKEALEKHIARVKALQSGGKPKATQSCVEPSDGKAIVIETLLESGMLGPQLKAHPALQGPLSLIPSTSFRQDMLFGPPGPFKQG